MAGHDLDAEVDVVDVDEAVAEGPWHRSPSWTTTVVADGWPRIASTPSRESRTHASGSVALTNTTSSGSTRLEEAERRTGRLGRSRRVLADAARHRTDEQGAMPEVGPPSRAPGVAPVLRGRGGRRSRRATPGRDRRAWRTTDEPRRRSADRRVDRTGRRRPRRPQRQAASAQPTRGPRGLDRSSTRVSDAVRYDFQPPGR
jgi:hypothetical protein